MLNKQIALIFRQIADILEIKGENLFRIRAYQKAAENLENLEQDLVILIRDNQLETIPGIGKDLSSKIKEYYKTGKISYLKKLFKTVPEGVLDLIQIPGMGPKKAKLFYEKLQIKSIPELKKVLTTDRLKGLFGIKDKTIDNLKSGISQLENSQSRMNLGRADRLASYFVENLKKSGLADNVSVAGSLRRSKESIRDIDILAVSKKPAKLSEFFTNLAVVKDIHAKGNTKASILTDENTQVDLRIVKKEEFGSALLYFTGSKNFNIKLRQLAIKKGFKVNEYGLFKKNRLICGKTESEIFKKLDLEFIPPEMREDLGEIKLARNKKLPRLIKQSDIKGDLHIHSNYSDGVSSIAELADQAKRLGYEYIAISDHSQSLRIAGGLDKKQLIKKKKEIDRLNAKLKGIRVFFGTEVEIDSSGNLDYPLDILKDFDIVIAAIHSGFKQSKEKITQRILKAINNKYVNIIAHPTGKLWGVRDSYDFDYEKVFKAVHENNTFLEINSFPERLDLSAALIRQAHEYKAGFCINTDSHNRDYLSFLKYGVSTARRGWLEKKDVINTLSLKDLLKKIKK